MNLATYLQLFIYINNQRPHYVNRLIVNSSIQKCIIFIIAVYLHTYLNLQYEMTLNRVIREIGQK